MGWDGNLSGNVYGRISWRCVDMRWALRFSIVVYISICLRDMLVYGGFVMSCRYLSASEAGKCHISNLHIDLPLVSN